jgi:hypothetical protein
MQTTVRADVPATFDAGGVADFDAGGVADFETFRSTCAAGAQSCKASRRATGASNFILGLCRLALFTKEF